MIDVIKEAKAKIKAEVEKNKGNEAVNFIGEFLDKHIQNIPADAIKVADGKKSIMESLAEMGREAQKKKKGNFAMFTPEEGLQIIAKYYGLTSTEPSIRSSTESLFSSVKSTNSIQSAEDVKPKKASLDIDLEDLF